MKLNYSIAPDGTLRDVEFVGATGQEQVHTVKGALQVLQLEAPGPDFIEAVKRGEYNSVSDEEYSRILLTMRCIQELFRFPDRPKDAAPLPQMNVLSLLANAMTRLVELDVELRGYRKGANR